MLLNNISRIENGRIITKDAESYSLFVEEDHPRESDGKFTSKGGSSSSNEEEGSANALSLGKQIKSLKVKEALAKAAQEVYEEWEQDSEGNDEELGTGGICDRIADKLGFALNDVLDGEFDVVDGTPEGDEHANIIVHNGKEAFQIDISPGLYERGSGYSYTKVPNVKFDAKDIEIYSVDIDDVLPSDSWEEDHKE